MANPLKNRVLLTVLLMAVLGPIWSGRVSAQGFQTLYSFTLAPGGDNIDGRNPLAGLFLAGSLLFGTAYSGGQHGSGEIFGVNTDGTGFTPYYAFSQAADNNFTSTNREGGMPQAPLVFTGTALYGVAGQLGTNGSGTVFELSLATGVKVLHTFTAEVSEPVGNTNVDGARPAGGLLLSGTSLYGTAEYGGAEGNGTVFKVDDTSLVFSNLHSFDVLHLNQQFISTNRDGANPQAGLVLSGSVLFGTTSAGGANGSGTIFCVTTNGTNFITLHHFAALALDSTQIGTTTNSDGAYPVAGLVLTNNTLYGVAEGGGLYGNGTAFSINTNGLGFTVLHTFSRGATDPSLFGHQYTNNEGAAPAGDMVLSGKLLYGTASTGGLYANGTVFSLGTNGGGFATLYAFSATVPNQDYNFTNRDGAAPVGGLILSSNVLYGTTEYGGTEADGTLFSLPVLPRIGIVRSGNNVVMTWTTNVTGYTMEFATNLAPTEDWVTNPTAPGILNGQYALTNSISGKQKFFRLIQ